MTEPPAVVTREVSIDRPPRILVVEDEAPLGELLTYNLKAEGFEVEHVDRGDEAELRLAETPFDLIILDWMLPGVSGLEICRRVRTRNNIRDMPIIMLTARCEENDRVRGLSVGADDYVVKPFSTPELMLRIRALLRRARPERVASKLTLGDIDLDRVNRRVKRAGREIHLGPTEFRMLEYLMEKPGRVFSALNCLTLFGDLRRKSTNALSTFRSAGCARRSCADAKKTRSAQCAAPAIRSTKSFVSTSEVK